MRPRDDQSGFTLAEILVAMAVLGFVMLGVTSVYLSNQRAYERGQSQMSTHQNARVGIEMLARELRMAGFDPQGQIALQASPTTFQTATANSLTFLADVSGDDTLDRVTYRVVGDRLIRDISSWDGTSFPTPTAGEVASGLSGLSFGYSDAADAAMAAPVTGTSRWDIRRVTVDVQTTESTVNGPQETYDLTIDLRPRNLL